jgi:hypothetical protein
MRRRADQLPQRGRGIRPRWPGGRQRAFGQEARYRHYGPGVPIGGGALAGKDPHKVDKCGALRARQLAKKLVREGVDEARVTLGWAPGGMPHFSSRRRPPREGLACRCRGRNCRLMNGSPYGR